MHSYFLPLVAVAFLAVSRPASAASLPAYRPPALWGVDGGSPNGCSFTDLSPKVRESFQSPKSIVTDAARARHSSPPTNLCTAAPQWSGAAHLCPLPPRDSEGSRACGYPMPDGRLFTQVPEPPRPPTLGSPRDATPPCATCQGLCMPTSGSPCDVHRLVKASSCILSPRYCTTAAFLPVISLCVFALALRLFLHLAHLSSSVGIPRRLLGGHLARLVHYGELEDFIVDGPPVKDIDHVGLLFKGVYSDIEVLQYSASTYLHVKADITVILPLLTARQCISVAAKHGILCGSKCTKSLVIDMAQNHSCAVCYSLTYVYEMKHTKKFTAHFSRVPAEEKQRIEKVQLDKSDNMNFPPLPTSKHAIKNMVTACAKEMKPSAIEEAGCAVCGQLVLKTKLSKLRSVKNLLHVLEVPGMTRLRRRTECDPIRSIPGPVTDHSLYTICDACRATLRKDKLPKYALARGLWIGEVPPELQDLRFVEKLVIARVRYSNCFVRVSSGFRKMIANALAFESPVPKIYARLPISKAELDEVLVILFTGPKRPEQDDLKRTPFLVRANKVRTALEWLILNHSDYEQVSVDEDNLSQYNDNTAPVTIQYKETLSAKLSGTPAVNDMEEEDGTEDGPCPFVIHGLTGAQMEETSSNTLKTLALQYFNQSGRVLAIGQSSKFESIWNNPQLYPSMFPWLFPYGLGGIGSVDRMSTASHKRWLLMYHDKRFQTDATFPFIAFSHEQIMKSSRKAFLLTEKSKFKAISERILNIDEDVLASIAARTANGEHIKPETAEEKNCFDIVRDLDHIAGGVSGSPTSKKYQRNEIWSLMYHVGSPIWYITLSPVDIKHPICIYYAGTDETFQPVMPADERMRTVTSNPVACARFFKFMVNVFIDEIVRFDGDGPGVYGDVEAYYGTVEQQGRLSLHLHAMLWILGSLSPQEIRDNVLKPDGKWKKRIVEWLESCHKGEFLTGTHEEVEARVASSKLANTYVDHTLYVPEVPPHTSQCNCLDETCDSCNSMKAWWSCFSRVTDEIVLQSNVHDCDRYLKKDGTQNKLHVYKGCKDNKWGKCKARFPRTVVKETEVNRETGSIILKKLEQWINTFTPLISYIMRSNTDVTSMMSGTAVKAVVAYVSDYITKCGLKTHVVFECIQAVLTRNPDILNDNGVESVMKARQIMTKVVNLMGAKLEMGSPMICMYLLGHQDHYTSHEFKVFYWTSYVSEARSYWHPDDAYKVTDKVALMKTNDRVVGLSPVFDYVHRPESLQNMCLYDWAIRCKRIKATKPKPKKSSVSNDGHDGREEGGVEDTSAECGNDSDDEEDNDKDDEDTDKFLSGAKRSKQVLLEYKPEHPLSLTHRCSLMLETNKKLSRIVLNFMSAPPRRDQGDREYYCSAMLAFFVPWRSGKDLKAANATWDEAFLLQNFSAHHTKIMNNFNLRYECLDAKDDFRTEMKTGVNDELSLPLGDDMYVANRCEDDLDGLLMDASDINLKIEADKMCAAALRRDKAIKSMKAMMQNANWATPLHVSEHTCANDTDLVQQQTLPRRSPREWRQQVLSLRQQVLEARKQAGYSNGNSGSTVSQPADYDYVKVVDKSFLEASYIPKVHRELVAECVDMFSLNEEQNRAFTIVANHSVAENSGQLKMYIGGMGGTGKSQVLKALVHLFTSRNELHKLLIVAPTASAACLLPGGMTYHSAFGINFAVSKSILSSTKDRLEGVFYIFFDEISMCSARDLHNISVRICLSLNALPGTPFGGLNMIFAGDFAQLPPPIGGESVSLYSHTIGSSLKKLKQQEEAFGKVLWHQVTTVVILRKNMRQKSQTAEDAKFRAALENMRYRACTLEDIQFLRGRVSANVEGRPSVCNSNFRNVSIITARHVNKDAINVLGEQRFAAEHKLNLTTFYCEDTVAPIADFDEVRGKKRATKVQLKEGIQRILWEQPPCSVEKKIPAKLNLCKGLPVMLRDNSATELCMTNGQEGIVYDWVSTIGVYGQPVLDVLFVKLTSPPVDVQFDSLPLNVVPILRTASQTWCELPSGKRLHVSRSQVEVTVNYAMTDFASQGKTRVHNVVHLNDTSSHQGYYTALSRSATAAGTLILQAFNPAIISDKKCSGALRQEFRDIELLDDITRLQFEGRLPASVTGETRRTLIHAFRQHKSDSYVPQYVHSAIRWNKKQPYTEPDFNNLDWSIIPTQQMTKFLPNEFVKQMKEKTDLWKNGDTEPSKTAVIPMPIEKSNTLPGNTLKRGIHDELISNVSEITAPKKKRVKAAAIVDTADHPAAHNLVPIGCQWSDNSCAYDTVVSLLYNVWLDRPRTILALPELAGSIFPALVKCFERVEHSQARLTDVRNYLRQYLCTQRPNEFVYGEYASISAILDVLLSANNDQVILSYSCAAGHCRSVSSGPHASFLVSLESSSNDSVSAWCLSQGSETHRLCTVCTERVMVKQMYKYPPYFVAFDFGAHSVHIDREVHLTVLGTNVPYYLKCIIYYGRSHFVGRYIDKSGRVWVYDGMSNSGVMEYDSNNPGFDLSECRHMGAITAVYVRSPRVHVRSA